LVKEIYQTTSRRKPTSTPRGVSSRSGFGPLATGPGNERFWADLGQTCRTVADCRRGRESPSSDPTVQSSRCMHGSMNKKKIETDGTGGSAGGAGSGKSRTRNMSGVPTAQGTVLWHSLVVSYCTHYGVNRMRKQTRALCPFRTATLGWQRADSIVVRGRSGWGRSRVVGQSVPHLQRSPRAGLSASPTVTEAEESTSDRVQGRHLPLFRRKRVSDRLRPPSVRHPSRSRSQSEGRR
jgi:hypothetical protein